MTIVQRPDPCVQVVTPWEIMESVGTLSAGTYNVEAYLNAGLDYAATPFTVVNSTLSTLTISPPSGNYVATQRFDLTLIVETSHLLVIGGNATLDGSDVTSALASCIVIGTLISGGQTFRCPGLTGGTLGTGTYTLSVTLDLSDGSSVSDTVAWEFMENTEP